MSKLIWFPFYVNDFLGDTVDLTATELGIYLSLLIHCFKHGSVPDDIKKLSRITKISHSSHQKLLRGVLERFFAKQFKDSLNEPNKTHFFVNMRMEEERISALNRSEKGKKAAEKRWSESDEKVCSEHCLDDGSHSHIHIHNKDINNKYSKKTEEEPIPPKKLPSKKEENTELRKDILETFYGKDFSTFQKGALKQIYKAIDTWEKETSYTDIDLYEMVIGYDDFWIDLEASGEPTKYKRSKNIATFLKKEDLFKYLCSDTNSAGTTLVSESDAVKEEAEVFKKYKEIKKQEREASDSYLER